MTTNTLKRFALMFRGLERAYGQMYNNKRMETVKKEISLKSYQEHLEGTVGLGVIPINDDSECFFAAVDIDNPTIEHKKLSMNIKKLSLPLYLCKSKSAGAHLYFFSSEPIKAEKIRKLLTNFSASLGYGGSEIFPKQDNLFGGVGNWINLPYFKQEERKCVYKGKELSLDEFIRIVNDNLQKQNLHKPLSNKNKLDMPPCLENISKIGIKEGQRNEILFNFALYYKQKTINWQEALIKLNFSKIEKSLSKREIDNIISSVNKVKEYHYKCNELINYCDKKICATRKYGIKTMHNKYDFIEFGNLNKVLSEPPYWILYIDSSSIELTTDELMSHKCVRKKVFEKLSFIIPPLKDEIWVQMLKDKLELLQEISAPDDAGIKGYIKNLLEEFLSISTNFPEFNNELKEDLERGVPICYNKEAYFRSQDFIQFLKRKRSEEVKGTKLWQILRQLGCSHKKIRLKNIIVQIWLYPFELKEEEDNNAIPF